MSTVKLKINGTPGASVALNGTGNKSLRVGAPLSSDASLAAWSYTALGVSHAVVAGGSYSIPNAYSTVESLSFVQTPTDGGASVSQLLPIGSALNVGPNTYTIRVTAADSSHADYSITLVRAAGGH